MNQNKNKHNSTLLLRVSDPPKSEPVICDDDYGEWARAVRAFNDAFRLSFTSTELHCSPQIIALNGENHSMILDRVRHYRNFTEENDFEMTHKRGFIEYEDHKIVWEIVYLDKDGKNISTDPLNLDLTQRYMMIMLDDEWWGSLPEPSS